MKQWILRTAAATAALALVCVGSAWAEDDAYRKSKGTSPIAPKVKDQKETLVGKEAPKISLEDYTGKEWSLRDLKDKEAIVLYIHGVGCPIVRQSMPVMENLKKKFSPKGVQFLYINSNRYDTAEDLKKDAEDFSISAPILMDQKQTAAKSLHVERTATVYIIDPQNDFEIIYQGAMDDRFEYGFQRPRVDNHWLRDALKAHLDGKEVPHARTEAKGCLINYVEESADSEEATG